MGASFFNSQNVQENDAEQQALANGEHHFRQATPGSVTPHNPRALFGAGGSGGAQGGVQIDQGVANNGNAGAGGACKEGEGAVAAALKGELLASGKEGELECFLWQKNHGSANKAEYKQEALFKDNVLCHGFVQKGSPILKVIHGVTLYYGNDAPELKKKLLGRVGEWTEDITPYLVELPVEKSWNWVKVKYSEDLEAWKNFESASAQNRLTLFRHAEQIVEHEVPYMFALPPRFALWAMLKERTCLEAYLYVLQLEQEGDLGITAEHTELLKKALMAGGQSQGGGTGAQGSALQDSATAVMSVNAGFRRWERNNMTAYLGQSPIKKQVVVQTPVNNDPALRVAVSRMEHSSNKMERMLQDKTDSKEKGKLLDDNQIAALKGFAGVSDWKLLPALYVVLKDCTDMVDARNRVLRGMEVWSSNKGIEIDESVALTEELIKNIKAIKPNPFITVGTSRTTDSIVSNMTCLPKSAAEMEKMVIGESAAGTTEANRTQKEREKQLKGESRRPPSNYFELKLNIATTCALVSVGYGERNELYKNLLYIYTTLGSRNVMQHKLKFTSLLCRQITWAIYDDMRSYFAERLMPEDFLKTPIKWPETRLADIFGDVFNLRPIIRPGFPPSWQMDVLDISQMGAGGGMGGQTFHQQYMLPPPPPPPPSQGGTTPGKKAGAGGGHPPAPPSGPSPFVCPPAGDNYAHLHPKIKVAMGRYHSVVRRHGIQWILQKAGVRMDQLPTLEGCADPVTGRSLLCWNNLTGVCFHGDRCKFAPRGHVKGDRLPDAFVDHALKLLMPGIDGVVKDIESRQGNKRPYAAVGSAGHYGPADTNNKSQRR